MDIIKMCYSIEPGDRRYVKGYEFLSFAKNIDKNIISNSLRCVYPTLYTSLDF